MKTAGMQQAVLLKSGRLCSRQRRQPGHKAASVVRSTGKGFGQKQEAAPKSDGQAKEQSSAGSDQLDKFAQKAQQQQRSQSPRPGTQEVPEVVNQRLLSRMLTFSLLPVFLGFLSLPILAYVQVGLKIKLPLGTAFAVSGLFFGAGLLGITYGILSASWDENEEGSKLGLDEFKSNAAPLFDRIKQGPKR